MSTKSEKFILERKEYWEKTYNIITQIEEKGITSLSEEDFLEFPNLYRKICTDSQTAKMLDLSPDLIEYVANLTTNAHTILYSSPKKSADRFFDFFSHDFPFAFFKNWIYILVIFILFFGSAILTGVIVYKNPQYVNNILPKQSIEQMKDMYKNEMQYDLSQRFYMAGFYISNNISIAFTSFVLGVTFGLGTILEVLYNGMVIGAVTGLLISAGSGTIFFNFVVAHSAFELLGIVLSAGAGFAIGSSLIVAKDEKRSHIFAKKAREVVPIVLVAGFFIFTAAFIEGFISPSKIDIKIKISVAIFSCLIIIIYSYKVFFTKIYKNISRIRRTLWLKHLLLVFLAMEV